MNKFEQLKAFRDLTDKMNMTAQVHYKTCPDFLKAHKDKNGGVILIVSDTNTSSCLFYVDNEVGEVLELDFLYRGVRKFLYLNVEDIDCIFAKENPEINIGFDFVFEGYPELHIFSSYKDLLYVLSLDRNFVEDIYQYLPQDNDVINKPTKTKPSLKLVVNNRLEDIKSCDREIIRKFCLV